jgi:hypothetical protein
MPAAMRSGRRDTSVIARLGVWSRLNLAFFAAVQLADVITTAYALNRGRVEGSILSRALMPDGRLEPWIVTKALAVALVAAVVTFAFDHRLNRRIVTTLELVILALSALTLVAAVQNVAGVLATG